ncbi:MAG: hypothetical protein AB7V22_10350 [Kiritimatiellia bacterium]
MKTRWRSVIGCVLLGVAAGMAGGCDGDDDLFDGDNWEFSNRSSYRVTVSPNGQYWLSVTLSPGTSAEVEYDGDRIQYVYSPSDKVRPDGSDTSRTIRFYDR